MAEEENYVLYPVKHMDTLELVAKQYGTTASDIINANPDIDFYHVPTGQKIKIPKYGKKAEPPAAAYAEPKNISAAELKNGLRSLWEQHVAWTRMAIISAANGLADLDATSARLLRNADDMRDALIPIYGEAKAANFGRLIKNHLQIALQLVKAVKAGDAKAANEADKSWHANASEIAEFLNSINPYISKEKFGAMLDEHLDLTKSEAAAILDRQYEKSTELYDRIEKQALNMADTMSNAIIRQFS